MNIKIDKRSQRTREALKKTLAQMMIKQNINDITIKNLVVLANINRSTFYLHYTDIFDLLQEMENVIESKVRKQINLIYCFNKSIAPEYVYSFLRSGCIGMLKTWIFSDCVTPPEEMAVFVYNTVHDIITRLIEDTSK